jgi:hypothetical protein
MKKKTKKLVYSYLKLRHKEKKKLQKKNSISLKIDSN